MFVCFGSLLLKIENNQSYSSSSKQILISSPNVLLSSFPICLVYISNFGFSFVLCRCQRSPLVVVNLKIIGILLPGFLKLILINSILIRKCKLSNFLAMEIIEAFRINR